MLRYLLIAITLILLIPEILLFDIAFKVYREYRLSVFELKMGMAVLSSLYMFFTLVGNIVLDFSLAFIFFNVSIILLSFSGYLLYVYFYLLRTEKITAYVISLVIIFIVLKAISLMINPLKIYVFDDVILREAHLSPIAIILSSTIIFLILFELTRLYLHIRKKTHYRKYSRAITGSYSLIIIMLPLYIIGAKIKTISIIIPYLQGALSSVVVLYLVLYFRNHPERLVLLPVYARGLIIHTYGGLAIIKKPLEEKADRLVVLASALVASLISLEQTIIKLKHGYRMRVYNLIDSKILILFGNKSVGTIIVNRDNPIVRNILREIIREFETAVDSIDEGMITNWEIDLAERIIEKYLEFLV